jgi:hypothetical protein
MALAKCFFSLRLTYKLIQLIITSTNRRASLYKNAMSSQLIHQAHDRHTRQHKIKRLIPN